MKKIPFYTCHTYGICFFVDSIEDMGTNDVFLQQVLMPKDAM